MRDVAIAGTGITRFGKRGDLAMRTLAREAIEEALGDAGARAEDVEAAYCANAIAGLITGQEMVRGQVSLRSMGFSGLPVVNVENACAGGSTALHQACIAVGSGAYNVALVFGVEKMSHEDKRLSVAAIATALDVEEPVDHDAASPFMGVYAQKVREYLKSSEATVDDFARVAVKAQRNGAKNPRAQYGGEVTTWEVLDSPPIALPLTRLMCSPIGDGAAALLIVAGDALEHFPGLTPVWVRASVLQSGSDLGAGTQATERAVWKAYETAGLGPEDIDVVEMHDATAPGEIMRYEKLGFAAKGTGAKLIREGITEIEGSLPVNPSGGLLARGHPIGATGCAQVAELSDQLRGRAGDHQVHSPMVALAENGGGFIRNDTAAECIHILTV